MAEASTGPDDIEKDTSLPKHDISSSTKPLQSETEFSGSEKETLAVYEGHDADIPSNEGYVSVQRGEEKRRKSIVLHHQRQVQNGRPSKDNIEQTSRKERRRSLRRKKLLMLFGGRGRMALKIH